MLTTQIAKHVRNAYFGGNWTDVSLKSALQGVSWQQATQQVQNLNTIATLVFHIGYFSEILVSRLQGNPLSGSDKYSFAHPPIESEADWESFLANAWAQGEALAQQIEQMPETKLWEDFWENKYGNYYYNICGVVEHLHYHLGQISLIKKMLAQAA